MSRRPRPPGDPDLSDRLGDEPFEEVIDRTAEEADLAEVGRAALRAIYDKIRGLDETMPSDDAASRAALRQARLSAFAEIWRALEAVAALSDEDPGGFEAALALLDSLGGLSTHIGNLRSRVAAAGRARAGRGGGFRSVDSDEEIDLSGVLGVDLPPLSCPNGWVIQGDGVHFEKETADGVYTVQVTGSPVLITGILRSLSDDSERVSLEWRRLSGGWARKIYARPTVRDTRKIIDLGSVGLDVGADNAKQIVSWLARQERVNASRLPVGHVSDRMGWMGERGELGFMLGRRVVTDAGPSDPDAGPTSWGDGTVLLDVDEGERQIADGFAASGTLEGWREVASRALDHPSPMLGLYASLAAPFVALLPGAPNLIVDWSGETSKGKTTSMRLAASPWGRPDKRGEGVIWSWDNTSTFVERATALLHDLPLCLDDTKDARYPDLIERVLYAFSGGSGRGRGKPDGLRRTLRARGVLLSTGEAPITSFGPSAGARARTLCLRGSPFGDDPKAELVDAINLGALEHHGHAGLVLLQRLAAMDDRALAGLRRAYERHREAFAEAADSTVGKRFAPMLALLRCGAWAAHEVLGLPEAKCDPWEYAVAVAERGASDTDRPAAALAAVYGWAVSHETDFWERHVEDRAGVRTPARGWAGKWDDHDAWTEIAFDPQALERVLRHQGFPNAEEVLSAWQERGWLNLGPEKRRTKQRRVQSGLRKWLVCIRRDAIEEVLGEGGS